MGTTQKSKPPKGHHVIPAHLVGQFAIPETLQLRSRERIIWVYEKNRDPAKRSVESQCKENNYFSNFNSDGTTSTEHETKLNETVEVPFNKVLSVIENPLYVANREDALIVYRYVANMFTRSKQRRGASKTIRTEIEALNEKIMKDQNRIRLLAAIFSLKLGKRVFIEDVEEGMKNVATTRSVDKNKHSSDFVKSMDAFDADIVKMLDGRPYGLLTSPAGKYFVIGDNPVLTRTPYGNYLLVGDGFNKPNVHVLMPISPRSCLQIGLYGDFCRTVSSEEVDGINFDIISLCHRSVYACESNERVSITVNQSAGSRTYGRNVFVIPQMTEDQLFNHHVKMLLGIDPRAGTDDPLFGLWHNVLL